MDPKDREIVLLYTEGRKIAIEDTNTCYHPDCANESINSHILQKNGILSSIATDRHLWEYKPYLFEDPPFKFMRKGINKTFSFKCFCSEHDNNLFEKIEGHAINFDDYESCILFTLRTLYNEIYRKEVNAFTRQYCIDKQPEVFNIPQWREQLKQEKLGLDDLRKIETDIWLDMKTGSKNYVFEHREIDPIGICMSSFFNYDSTKEMHDYKVIHGTDMPRISEIFINFFPFQSRSILLMGYNKKDEKKVRSYFYSYFRESDKKLKRKISNLLIFHCETWVASQQFYDSKIKGFENFYTDASMFSFMNPSERRNFNINFFEKNFHAKFADWRKKYINK